MKYTLKPTAATKARQDKRSRMKVIHNLKILSRAKRKQQRKDRAYQLRIKPKYTVQVSKYKLGMYKVPMVAVALFIAFQMYNLIMVSANYYSHAQDLNRYESLCVARLVSSGVERINIATNKGDCWYEENGYYTPEHSNPENNPLTKLPITSK